MTSRRYAAYRNLMAELDVLSLEALDATEKALLRDAAEGFLLARAGAAEEVAELRTSVAIALSLLVGMGRWSDLAADRMWNRLAACGPSDGVRRGACSPSRTAGGSARTARPSRL